MKERGPTVGTSLRWSGGRDEQFPGVALRRGPKAHAMPRRPLGINNTEPGPHHCNPNDKDYGMDGYGGE